MDTGSAVSPVVLVDMDGVLADFDRAVLEGLPADIARVDRANFYISADYPSHLEQITALTSHPDFFRQLEPVAGAIDGWARLLALGFEPRICTAPLSRNPDSREGKLAWLEEHLVPRFGYRVIDRAIVDKRKYRAPGAALIDDRPEVDTNDGEATWQHIVFDHPYNRSSSTPFRLHGWADPDLATILDLATGRT